MMRAGRNRGFNLVETVVSSVILCSAVLTIGAISTRAVSGIRLNRQYETAASLIDRQLSLIDYMGIEEFIEQGQTEGVFEEYEPGYRWEVGTEYQDVDNLYLVTMTISWSERNRLYSVTVDTMFNGSGAVSSTEPNEE